MSIYIKMIRVLIALIFLWPGLAFSQASLQRGAFNGGTISNPLGIGENPAAGYLLDVGGSAKFLFQRSNPLVETNGLISYNVTTLSADNANDILGIHGDNAINPAGFHLTSQHNSGLYGISYGLGLGTIDWVNGVVGVSGNEGPGIVTGAVDFRGHNDLNTGGGTLTNHYFLYEENSTAAAHEYGAYFTAPIGIGQSVPTYNLDMSQGLSGNLSSSLWAKIGTGNGTIFMQSNGTSIYPASNNGAGTFSAPTLVVGTGAIPTASAGELVFTKIAATGTAPGGAFGKIELVCGTIAGSAKLISYAGTSITPATILDNIGTGVTGC